MALDSNGFTLFTESIDTRKVYVSSSGGNDTNDGLSELTPKATIAAGMALLRAGYPDWLLLKGGDEWTENLVITNRRGRSEDEKMLVSSYGNGRPVLKNARVTSIGGSGRTIQHFAVVGLDIYLSQLDPDSGDYNPTYSGSTSCITFQGIGENILIEDCSCKFGAIIVQGFSNTSTPGIFTSAEIRRNIICNAYNRSSHQAGIFASDIDGFLVEENYMDHNGWSEDAGVPATIFNHNIYIQYNCHNLTVRGNTICRGSSHGLQQRGGGLCEDNLFIHNAIPFYLGVSDTYTAPNHVYRNYIEGARDISGVPRGYGSEVYPSLDGRWEENIYADRDAIHANQYAYPPFLIEWQRMDQDHHNNGSNPLPPGTRGNIQFNRNYTRNWAGTTQRTIYDTFRMPANDPPLSDYHIGDLIVDGKDKAGNPLDLVDPTRNIAAYMTEFGTGGGFAELDAWHRSRGRGAWDTTWAAETISSWIRAGFQLQTEPEECECEARFQQIEGQISVLQNQMLMIGQIASGTASVCEEEESNP